MNFRSIQSTQRLLAALLIVFAVMFQSFAPVHAYSNHYVIRNYDVDITVHENNSFDIVETLDVYFDEGAGKHGIIRTIPLSNKITRTDGSTSRNHARISGLSVDGGDYTADKSYSSLTIRIGSETETVEGSIRYVIRYNYDIGRDPLPYSDEFYYNIVGTSWDTSIEHVDFRAAFPKEFDPSSLGFSVGQTGSTSYEGVFYKVDGNTVSGYYDGTLPAFSGLTMRMEMEEGYFVRAPSFLERMLKPLMGVPLLGALLVLLIYRKFGSDRRPAEPVMFYPPDGMNPLDTGYLYDDSLDSRDITSLMVYLANQGYLSIRELDGDDYEICLLRDWYDGDNTQEAQFFDGLKTRSFRGVVKSSSLEANFCNTVRVIKKGYLRKDRRNSIYLPVGPYKTIAVLTGTVSLFLSLMVFFYTATRILQVSLFLGILGTLLLVLFGYMIRFGLMYTRKKPVERGLILFSVLLTGVFVIGAFFGLFVRLFLDYSEMIGNPILPVCAAGAVLGIVSIVLGFRMKRHTDEALKTLGEIRGFRNFLIKAEKPKLERLVEEDPSYFYSILPYTYVLGVSDKWIRKFDDIALEAPSWYSGEDLTGAGPLSRTIDRSVSRVGKSMTSVPSSSVSSSSSSGYSSADSSGGGSAGGGSGGGGGSSW